MSFNRRSFIRSNALIAGALLLSDTADALASVSKQINTVSASLEGVNIFHTNDMNGQVSGAFKGFGGLDLFKKSVKDHEFRGLLLDGGGFLNADQTQAQHREFIELMNRTGYHAATIGAAELSSGQEHLAALTANMSFTLVNCNYTFSDQLLKQKVKPYIVLKYGKHRIGVTGVGPELSTAGVDYNDPSKSLKQVTAILKEQENCSLVICLAHLGFEGEMNNLALAQKSANIDLVIGGDVTTSKGHGTSVVKNQAGYDVFVTHTAGRASVFNHTSIAANKTVQIRTAIPGVSGGNATARELAALNLPFNDHLV
ncbi:hypothetical protein GZH53_03680 [Flavihumibacter sp. R14]|nr:hypothetical protein [Flavihumibacter soli]